jgi:hypothetical protein
MLMRWFPQHQLNNLHDHLNKVQDRQNWLLLIQMVQLQCIDEIDAAIQELFCALKTGHSPWVNYHSLEHAQSQLQFNLHKPIRALNLVHYCRRLIDLLPIDHLRDLFDAAVMKARMY